MWKEKDDEKMVLISRFWSHSYRIHTKIHLFILFIFYFCKFKIFMCRILVTSNINKLNVIINTILYSTVCKESFFILSAYMTHLMGHEHAMVPCQVCNMTVEKKSMARHLLLHSIGLYECVYCLFGANTKSTMALHVSNAHSSKPLYCCVRYNKKVSIRKKYRERDVLKKAS